MLKPAWQQIILPFTVLLLHKTCQKIKSHKGLSFFLTLNSDISIAKGSNLVSKTAILRGRQFLK